MVPNAFGGREDLEAVGFLRELNEVLHEREPGVLSIAEESTAWPGVSRPTYLGGLGFGFKWNMGWMHDTLEYFSKEPVHRRPPPRADLLAGLRLERELRPAASHDEVVHGKRSLLGRMPGDRWQAFANLRALYGYMWAHPGKQLLFMGCEFGQVSEWSEQAGSLDWHLLEEADHAGVQALVRDLNRVYVEAPALGRSTTRTRGFRWLEPNAAGENVLAFVRLSADGERQLVCVSNLSRSCARAGGSASRRRKMARGAQHRLPLLWRLRRRQRAGTGGGAGAVERAGLVGGGDAAAARDRLARPRRRVVADSGRVSSGELSSRSDKSRC